MKKKLLSVIFTIFVVLTILLSNISYANTSVQNSAKPLEYSKEYQEWLELSDEEKEKVMQPRMFNINTSQNDDNYIKGTSNIFKASMFARANLLTSYSLKNVIPKSVTIKNQGNTNTCWAFATLGMLESSLAMRNENNEVQYDYSEKHMNYATSRNSFLNNQINPNGFNRKASAGGNFYIASAYLTNGSGAVLESDMPFDNSVADIDISSLQGKEIATTVSDIVSFNIPANESEKNSLITQMKEHITVYGGLFAPVCGGQLMNGTYNNETGALYSSNLNIDHAIVIIGWDDNYDANNFKSNPGKNGAWIIKNSWGDNITLTINDIKKQLYEGFTEQQRQEANLTSPDDIPDSFIISKLDELIEIYKGTYGESKVTKDANNSIVIEVGNKGYMYVSYEDANIYNGVFGIKVADDKVEYKNIYQNDILGCSNAIEFTTNQNIYIANTFTRDSSIKEAINKISINTLEEYECEVYINPNGTSKTLSDLKKVKLKAGDTVTVEQGYHTIEFAEPINLTGNSFTVVVKIINNTTRSRTIAIEAKTDPTKNPYWSEAEINRGESFVAFESDVQANTWVDLMDMQNETLRGNVCIKAFTTNEVVPSPSPTPSPSPSPSPSPTPTPSSSPSPVPEEKEPINSNFEDTFVNATDAKFYFSSTNEQDTKIYMKVKISNIKLGDEEDTYTYYYYISSAKNENNIPDEKWVKIEEKPQKESDDTYSISFTLDKDIIKNYNDITENDKIYMYIREDAQINGKTVQKVVSEELVTTQVDPIIYLDGKKIGTLKETLEKIEIEIGNNNGQSGNNSQNGVDNTTATGKLPQTGEKFTVIIAITILLAGIAFSYFKFHKNKDIK